MRILAMMHIKNMHRTFFYQYEYIHGNVFINYIHARVAGLSTFMHIHARVTRHKYTCC